MNFTFERPLLAVLAILSPFVLTAMRHWTQAAFSLHLSLGPPGGKSFSPSLSWHIFIRIMRIMEIGAVSLLLFAAAGPLVITRDLVWLDRGGDIIFVVDCSPSMAALDMDGENRFDTAKNLARNFVVNRPADAAGLIAVGNEAALLIPPTIDHTVFLDRLFALQVGELGDGTALGMGIALAALHLEHSQAPQKAVILITDGENNAGSVHPAAAAEQLLAEGISFYVIGVGSKGDNILIDYIDPVSKVRRTGKFESRFNGDALENLAKIGGGQYLAAPSADAFAAAFKTVNKREATVSRGSFREQANGIHREIIIFALLIILFSRFLRKYIFGSFL
jgi:Ca-activated chloride channel family protein